jgi:hypothetical protein
MLLVSIRGLSRVADVRDLVDSDVCLNGSHVFNSYTDNTHTCSATILKLSALRASLTYDRVHRTFAPNERASSFAVSMLDEY